MPDRSKLDSKISRLAAKLQQDRAVIGYDNNVPTSSQVDDLDPKTTRRIAEQVYRINDILSGKVGAVSSQDRERLLNCVVESVADGIDIDDAVIGLESYIQEAYISGTSTNFGTPSQAPAPGAAVNPAPGTQTSTAVKPVTPAANVSIGGAGIMNPDKFKQDIANKLKTDPNASKDFAEILAKLMVKR